MRILTKVPWTYIELESYRQIIFVNLVDGMKRIIQSLEELGTSLKGDPRALDAYNVNPFPPSTFSLQLTSLQPPSVYWKPPMCKKASHFHGPVTRPSIFSGHTLKSKMGLRFPHTHYRTSAFLDSYSLSAYLNPKADQPYNQPVFTTSSPNSIVSLR